jgi:predicted nucleic acid-binding protein
VRFWDSSAVIPLIVEEPAATHIRALLQDDPRMAVWWTCVVECWSALARRRRDGTLSLAGEEAARSLLRMLQSSWIEIQPGEEVRMHAGRLLRVHPLRAPDALQLAAALTWAGGPGGVAVILDQRLREAARLEGLTVVP